MNAVTKAGTAYEFPRNDALDASGCHNARKPPLRRNNFGFTAGGPIVRNRSFFFHNYDGLFERNCQSLTRRVGLPAWRGGDFSTATRDTGGRAAPAPFTEAGTPLL